MFPECAIWLPILILIAWHLGKLSMIAGQALDDARDHRRQARSRQSGLAAILSAMLDATDKPAADTDKPATADDNSAPPNHQPQPAEAATDVELPGVGSLQVDEPEQFFRYVIISTFEESQFPTHHRTYENHLNRLEALSIGPRYIGHFHKVTDPINRRVIYAQSREPMDDARVIREVTDRQYTTAGRQMARPVELPEASAGNDDDEKFERVDYPKPWATEKGCIRQIREQTAEGAD